MSALRPRYIVPSAGGFVAIESGSIMSIRRRVCVHVTLKIFCTKCGRICARLRRLDLEHLQADLCPRYAKYILYQVRADLCPAESARL